MSENDTSTDGTEYPWNLEVDVGGVTFTGPGMESKAIAEDLKQIVEETSDVDNVRVIQQ